MVLYHGLDVADGLIGAEVVRLREGFLRECRLISNLNLNYNFIMHEGAERMAADLWHCPSLARLDLAWNSLET